MATTDRGFNKLKGKTIKAVDASAINQVLLLCEDGTVFEINAADGGSRFTPSMYGIPAIELVRRKEKLDKFPRKAKPKEAEWPYPATNGTPEGPCGCDDVPSAESAWPFPTSWPATGKTLESEKGKVYKGGSKNFDERKGRRPTPGEVLRKDLKKPPTKKKPPAKKKKAALSSTKPEAA